MIRQILGFFTIKGGPNIVIFVNKRRHRGSVQDGATIMIERPHIYLGWSLFLREVVLLAELLQQKVKAAIRSELERILMSEVDHKALLTFEEITTVSTTSKLFEKSGFKKNVRKGPSIKYVRPKMAIF